MILQVCDLAFSYASQPVLDRIRFNVKRGELLAILGPNGVGKTTLLKCINSILRPTDGAVLVEDRDVASLAPASIARAVGYVAQRCEGGRMTVFDAVLMGRKPHMGWKVSKNDLKIVDAALKRLDMSRLALRHIDRLSGGELQKVSIARALVQEPRLLLLDEPTSSLDMRNQVEILGMLSHVVREHGIAGVMTMHDLNIALRYAHKFLLLKQGTVYACGECSQLSRDMVEAVYGVRVEIHHCNGAQVVVPAQA